MKRKLMALFLVLVFVVALGGATYAASGTYSGVTWTTSSSCTKAKAYVCMTSNVPAELEAYGVVSYRVGGETGTKTYVLNPYGESTTRVSGTWNAGTDRTATKLVTTYKVKGALVSKDEFNP